MNRPPVDNAPTDNSPNLVTSGGVKAVLNGIETDIGDIDQRLDTLEAGEGIAGSVAYAVKGERDRAEGAEEALGGRIDGLEDEKVDKSTFDHEGWDGDALTHLEIDASTNDIKITAHTVNVKTGDSGTYPIDVIGTHGVEVKADSASELEISGEDMETDIDAIEEKIPAQASSTNQLADKNFVNSSINSLAANFVACDAANNNFPTKADLLASTVWYHAGASYVPTVKDYMVVLADESEGGAQTRYVVVADFTAGVAPTTEIQLQYVINDAPFTAAQNAAINSGATAEIIESVADKADKPETSTAGHLAALDGSGNLTDSGKNTSDFAPSEAEITDEAASQALPSVGSSTPEDLLQEARNCLKYIIGAMLTDAPSDGQQYARRNGAWSVVTGGGGTISDFLWRDMNPESGFRWNDMNPDSGFIWNDFAT